MITTLAEPAVRSISGVLPEDRFLPATLELASIGKSLTVRSVEAPLNAPEWARWLGEIGFIEGESVTLMARALPGGDPLVVRVGQSTFALRRAEAACVHVIPSSLAARQGAGQ